MKKKQAYGRSSRPSSQLRTAAAKLIEHHNKYGERCANHLPEPVEIKTVEQLADYLTEFYNNVYYLESSTKNKKGYPNDVRKVRKQK